MEKVQLVFEAVIHTSTVSSFINRFKALGQNGILVTKLGMIFVHQELGLFIRQDNDQYRELSTYEDFSNEFVTACHIYK